ncbi:phosphonate ABC transporter, permease protein PhnE [Vagococcus xieshaowenii]|uniref:Phosphonate ABC transporter, permease protein PhnE n=1 Tax=Vagococcus xieshaowenii TaxID=2562451 RepID=A0AAJ5EEL7_9ENTE|nr:phosphonate ABC transporter, permease protein PhnE [Vagococcus xieshaowenii]QCA27910.1 phosphonate ABC transporter, permease protein PhnE [Vagococcus xieshaowenii]TFZ39411.1 phosphonate ABC transporter, permease protein PhnE [Vagococcus xieshaowenii]
MMIRAMSKKTIISLVLLIILVFLSAINLDYSGLKTLSPSMGMDVLRGLAKPKWDFFYDGSGEDLLSLLLLTIGIACLGTMLATILAIPITLISSTNLWQSYPWVTKVGKFICNVLRAFPELIFALIFVKLVGPGPFAGVMAIGVHQIGMLGKLFTEEMESMDEKLIEEMQAVGANFWQIIFYVRIPYLMPIYSSLALNHFEIAVRSAATLGLVGAGGIGAPLIFAIQTRSWDKVSIILIGVVITVFILDQITGIIRKKLR